jgi:hypothetical protein
MSTPAISADAIPYDSATPILAEDGTPIYCVFDVVVDDAGNVASFQFTDCPQPATLPSDGGLGVPDVLGLALSDAQDTLDAAGFVVGDVSEASDPDVPAGVVISQDPAPGTEAAPGEIVFLVVSMGGSDDAVGSAQDYSDLGVGDSFVTYDAFGNEQTAITLERLESGIKTSPYSKPDQGMTTLALLFTFTAGPEGGRTNLVSAYGPTGTEYEDFYGAEGKYSQGWDYTEIRPDKTVQGWKVFEVPRKGNVEVVMSGHDEYGEELFATWVVKP